MEFLKFEPEKFYALSSIIRDAPKGSSKELSTLIKDIGLELGRDLEALTDAVNAMNEEARQSSMTENRFKPVQELAQEKEKTSPTAAGFLWVCHAVVRELCGLYSVLGGMTETLNPPEIRTIPMDDRERFTFEGMQKLHLMIDMNGPAMDRYFGNVFLSEGAQRHVVQCAKSISEAIEPFYRTLLKRHTEDGIEVARTPILTDVALTIYKNIDLNGELEGGTDVSKISAYTVRRGQVVARALHDDPMGMFVRASVIDGNDMQSYIREHLDKAWMVATRVSEAAKKVSPAVKQHLEPAQHHRPAARSELDSAVVNIRDVNPNLVRFRDRAVVMSAEERFQVKFMNETVRGIVDMIMREDADPVSVVEFVVSRKSSLNKHNRDENSFYVCRIGSGNKLQQKAPGELEVVPGEKPKVNIDEILGAGYDDLRKFARTIESSSRWHSLFVATSPSKTADKSNVLLIGPQGVGKTEVMRGVGAENGSISIFAQGSDFLTCWEGEAIKNPKRLFQAAIRLQKESGRHVHLLLDEIDSVLRKTEEKRSNDVDLTLEFQILMDGVVQYPGVTLWGATNSPGKIPMPLIRRFNKVMIVGELSSEDRAKLLERFSRTLPLEDFDERTWARFAERLDGATGDVVRKVVDHVWRDCVDGFTRNHEAAALEVTKWLSVQGPDGGPLDIGKFTEAQRAELRGRLLKHVKVTPRDMEGSIEAHLKNAAVRAEISTAKAVYREAKEMVMDMARGQIEIVRA